MSGETWKILRGLTGVVAALIAVGQILDHNWIAAFGWSSAALGWSTTFTEKTTVTRTIRTTRITKRTP